MITVPLSRLRQLRTVARRALGITPRGPSPPVVVEATEKQITVRCGHARGVVEHLTESVTGDGFEPARLVLPFDALAAFGGRGDVRLEPAEGGRVVARWTEKRVPQIKTLPAEDDSLIPKLPVPKLSENPPTLLAALHEAMLTTDRESVRYALGAVQLRGRQGVLAATDSRQALLQSGFDFGWDGEVLLPRTTVFASKELPQDGPVSIGVDAEKKWLCLRVSPWTFHFVLLTEGRFPRVEDIIASAAGAEARVQFGEADAAFLIETLPKLPGGEQPNRPVTLDLNGPVTVRTRGDDDRPPTEIVLTGSQRTGRPMRLNMNREFLHRAVTSGFRRLLVFDPESPLQARGENRVYLWALLTPEEALPPARDAQRLTTPTSPEPAKPRPSAPRTSSPSPSRTPAAPPAERRPRAMPRSSPEQHPNGRHHGNTNGPPVTAAELIERAEEVRASLRHAVAATGELIAGLKRHKKRSTLVCSTLQSLKQLQGLEP